MMAEMFDSRNRQANTQLASGQPIPMTGLGPLQLFSGVVRSGLKTLRTYAVFCLIVLLLPVFLALTRDWICVLVVFKAFTAAVRLQNVPPARTLSSCSSTGLPASAVKGENRAL